jgi:hypothetical protein
VRPLAVALLLATPLAAAPRLKEKPPDLSHIKVGLEFVTADGYTVTVTRDYRGVPDWRDRVYCEYVHFHDGMWMTSPVFVGEPVRHAPEYSNLRPPTRAYVDALYRGTARLKP